MPAYMTPYMLSSCSRPRLATNLPESDHRMDTQLEPKSSLVCWHICSSTVSLGLPLPAVCSQVYLHGWSASKIPWLLHSCTLLGELHLEFTHSEHWRSLPSKCTHILTCLHMHNCVMSMWMTFRYIVTYIHNTHIHTYIGTVIFSYE